MNGEGSQLAQVRPSGTAAVTAYTNPLPTANRGLNVEITRIVICNTTAGAVNCSLYHDNDGTTFDQTTALRYAKAVPANDAIEILAESQNAGLHIKAGGSIGVQSSSANALTFTLYGVAQQTPAR